MAFRNPLYLDTQLLENLADYSGIDLAVDTQVTRRTVDERKGRAGISKTVELGKEKGSTEEVTEVFRTSPRPVRALNDVVDLLLDDGTLVDLTTDPATPFSQRDVIQVDGELELSPVTEIGALMAALMPTMIEQMAAGGSTNDIDPALIGRILLGGGPSEDLLHIFDLDTDIPDIAAIVLVRPVHLFGSATVDDLSGELTVVATVDRVIQQGARFSLERHLTPNLSRPLRRAMGSGGVSSLLESFTPMLGRAVDESSISVNGPALLLTPIAIY